jgi:hypothetical protein
MNSAQLRLAVGFSTSLALFAGHVSGFAQETGAREKAAREAAVAYAKAYNLKTNRAAAVMKIAAVPFFPGEFHFGGSGPRVPLYAHLFKEDQDFRKWLDAGRHEVELSLKVLRVQRYEDFRKKYLEKEMESRGLGDLSKRLQQAARQALDQVVGMDGQIVFLGEKAELSQGILVRFEKGTAKIAGVLNGLNPDWKLSVFSVVRPSPKKGK